MADRLDRALDTVDVELDAADLALDRRELRQIAALRRLVRQEGLEIMGALDNIAAALAEAKSAAAAEHEQVMTDLAALNQKAVDLQAALDALSATATTPEEIAAVQAQAAELVDDIKAIDPDALPTPEPTPPTS